MANILVGALRLPTTALPRIPRQELIDAVDWMIGNLSKHLAQPRLSIHAIQFRGADQRVHGCGAFATCVGAGKQEVASAQGDAA